MPFATNDGVRIHWQEQGSGPPLLLIMGHLYSGDMWYPVLPALTARHRVLWFDNRGTGESDAPRTATLSDLAADARAVLDDAGVDRADVFGVSMGGGIALQLAHESPERVASLVLGCTAVKSPSLEQGKPRGTLRYRLPFWILRPIARKAMYGPVAPPDAVERDLEVMRKMKFSPTGVLAQDLAMQTYDMTADKVAALPQRSLVLHGEADRVVPLLHAHELEAALTDVRLVTYEGAGHNFIVDCTDRVSADVLSFLHEVDAAEEPACGR